MEVSPQHAASEDPLPESEGKASPPVDAILHVSVSNDGLQAFLTMEPPVNGGAEPTLKAIMAVLLENKITYQVDYEKLNHIAAKPVYHLDILVASGLAPVNGTDGTVTFLFRTEKSTLKPKQKENDTVDYRDLDIVESVVQGQTLCTMTLPTAGTPGISVRGKELPQKKGIPVPSYLGRNTELNQDGTAVLSKISGQVTLNGHQIDVDETFYIKANVDNSTGNLRVNGNLVVQGSVSPGFILEAGGSIEIKGTVEEATLKAGGHIKLYSGITGSEVHCGGDFECRYIESSRIFAVGSLNAESIVNSNVKSGKSITIAGAIAKIIGGSCVAGQNIEARSIGSKSNIKTKLELGTDQVVIERQQELLAKIADLEAQDSKLSPLIDILGQLEASNRLTQDKKKMLDNAQFTYKTNLQVLEAAKNEVQEIAQSLKAKGFGRVLCSDTVYAGTQVIIGDACLTVDDALKHITMYYKDGQVCVGTF